MKLNFEDLREYNEAISQLSNIFKNVRFVDLQNARAFI